MSAVDEGIVREFFEAHGFLICQKRKYIVQSRQKTGDEEIDLVVMNPRAVVSGEALPFELTPGALQHISRAVVAVKGWHTEVFAPGVLSHQPRIFSFVEKRAIVDAERLVGGDSLAKVLVVPGLPKDEKLLARSIEVLKSKGVDHVLSFRTILLDLIGAVATNRNYQKSDLLQILRLLKNYDLLKEPQMELKLKARKKQ